MFFNPTLSVWFTKTTNIYYLFKIVNKYLLNESVESCKSFNLRVMAKKHTSSL